MQMLLEIPPLTINNSKDMALLHYIAMTDCLAVTCHIFLTFHYFRIIAEVCNALLHTAPWPPLEGPSSTRPTQQMSHEMKLERFLLCG